MNTQVEIHTEEHSLSPDKDGVSFNAYVDGEKVECIITGAALKSQFKSIGKPIMDVFTENQEIIGSMAAFLISSRPQLIDGTVIIHPEDLRSYPGQ
ncbi:MAG: DUF1488 family protein [Bacillota bacterium]